MAAEEMKDAVRVSAQLDCMLTGTLVEYSFLFGEYCHSLKTKIICANK